MFYNLFKAQIIGRIGSVETINEGKETMFHKASIACNGFVVNKATGERTDRTEWVEVLLSGKTNIENFKVGRSVLVEGVPTVNAYNDKEGSAIGKLRIVAPKITFQDAKPQDEAGDTEPVLVYDEFEMA